MAIVLIFDCGATNLRTIAIDEQGQIIAAQHLANETQMGQESADYHVWDFEQIWHKLTQCAQQTLAQLGEQKSQIGAIAVTTFGVDGAPFDASGKQLYPVISWKCPRTIPLMESLSQRLDVADLYRRNGIGQYSFNTLFKLLWLQENRPDIWEKMDKFVFISSMLTQRLTGIFTSDRTMAGTSMMTSLRTQSWDKGVLELLGLTEQHFPPLKNAGDIIGTLKPEFAQAWGMAEVPVVSCGHDTQFAVFGSGAGLNQPVLSSGTWEILMARTAQAEPDFRFISHGLTTEFDACAQCFNPAVQWVGSGIMEWIGKLFFADVYGTPDYYATMIKEGRQALSQGKENVHFEGVFSQLGQGTLTGLSMFASRGEIYASALKYMAQQLKEGLEVLQQVSHFQAESLICVGGGSKNALWNQIRADTLKLPIEVVDVAESTVLGAAMFAFAAIGIYPSVTTAQQAMRPNRQRIFPRIQ